MKRNIPFAIAMAILCALALWSSIDFFRKWYQPPDPGMVIAYAMSAVILLGVSVMLGVMSYFALWPRKV